MRTITKDALPLLQKEFAYTSHNYHPLPVVLSKGQGLYVWDTAGRRYMDFLAAYSAANQGHCHPKIVSSLIEQSQKLTLTGRAFHNDIFPEYCEKITKLFGYDKVCPVNTGVEAGETALKLARRWAYEIKGQKVDSAKIVFCLNNFWGRTLAACASSENPDRNHHFGPFKLNFDLIPYGDIKAFQYKIERDPDVAAFFVEPVQGEGGVNIPNESYFKKVRQLCDDHKVLLIMDEIQTGLGRCGALLAQQRFGVKADITLLGKALSGGLYPVSAVLANDEIMQVFKPGTHGSTYGGNPLACKIAMTALDVIIEENMIENAEKQGQYFRKVLKEELKNNKFVSDIRGLGFMNCIEVKTYEDATFGYEICVQLAEKGILCKNTQGNKIRFTPPLVIQKEQVDEAIEQIVSVLKNAKI